MSKDGNSFAIIDENDVFTIRIYAIYRAIANEVIWGNIYKFFSKLIYPIPSRYLKSLY